MTDTILVGVDGSRPSIAALHWAIDEAHHRAVRVRAVTTYLPQGHIVKYGTLDSVATVTTQSVHAECVSRLAAIVHDVKTDVVVDKVVTAGEAEEVLVDMSAQSALLVIGSHGSTRINTGLVLGAVTTHCIRNATCPVVVIPAGLPRGP